MFVCSNLETKGFAKELERVEEDDRPALREEHVRKNCQIKIRNVRR